MNKTVVITGANSGIGRAAAFKFANQGYRVVMACRNIAASEPVRREIIESTGQPDVCLIQLDISSMQSIRSFCETYKKNYEVLDILIHNAGHFKHGEKSFQQNIDGFELTSSTNLLGPVLLTYLLLDVLERSYWRLLAILQRPFVCTAEEIGGAYYSICTSDRYAGVSGKLINHRGQIVTPADQTTPFLKILTSTDIYPPYADDPEAAERVWKTCRSYVNSNAAHKSSPSV